MKHLLKQDESRLQRPPRIECKICGSMLQIATERVFGICTWCVTNEGKTVETIKEPTYHGR